MQYIIPNFLDLRNSFLYLSIYLSISSSSIFHADPDQLILISLVLDTTPSQISQTLTTSWSTVRMTRSLNFFFFFDSETTSDHRGEGIDRGRDEGADGVEKARNAPALDDLLAPRGQVRTPAGGTGQASPHRRGGQDRGAPPQILPRPPPLLPIQHLPPPPPLHRDGRPPA